MKHQPLRQVERIFHLVAGLDSSERVLLLDELCGDDDELRGEVLTLLQGHDAENILDEPIEVDGLAAGSSSSLAGDLLRPGTSVGPYRILRPLGRGGMGAVYLAEQMLPVHRQVALKLIHHGLASDEVLRRFEAERQALALLECPNIARIVDAGTTNDGRPYFTMEHVDGAPITRYADDHQLDVRQRLQLFLQVCNGIRHAHQRGIVHRDIKPTNVLVTDIDGEPVVKIIDFGVARILQPTLASGDRTMAGVVLGTPEYMSPEQSDSGGRDVDIRSDVYSAGVLLFELLVGDLPFSREELLETQGPHRKTTPAPSQRLTELPDGGVTEAKYRHVSAHDLRRALRGELDWICLRALESDREERYQTVGALADDIDRALRNEAVLAGPPSAAYRVRKFARRHRLLIAASSLVLTGLIAATAISAAFYLREQTARSEAEKALELADEGRRRSEAVAEFSRKVLAELSSLRNTESAEVLDRALLAAIDHVENDGELDPRDRALVRVTLGHLCLQNGDIGAAGRLYKLAEAGFAEQVDANAYDYAECLMDIAGYKLHHEHEEQQAKEYTARAREIVGRGFAINTFEHVAIEVMAGDLLMQTDDKQGALDALRKVRMSFRSVEVLESNRANLAQWRITGLTHLFRSLMDMGELEEANEVLTEAKRVAKENELNDEVTRLNFHKSQATLSRKLDRWEAAAAAYDSTHAIYLDIFGEFSATTTFYAGRHADALARCGRFDEAQSIFDATIKTCENDTNLAKIALYRIVLFRGDMLRLRGNLDAAAQDYTRADAGFKTIYFKGNEDGPARVDHRRGLLNFAWNNLEQAEHHFERAHEVMSRRKGPKALEALESAHWLARVRVKRGDFATAEPLALSTHELRASALGPEAPATLESVALIEEMYEQWSRPDALGAWKTQRDNSVAAVASRSATNNP